MPKLSFIWLFGFILLGMLVSVSAQQPPIIDRELFFGDPEISGAQISPDGKWITFLKQYHGVRNIWLRGVNQKWEEARPITADTKRPVTSYFWSWDSKFILYVQDKDGDENYRIYGVNPFEPGEPVPPARNLTPFENVRAGIIDVPRNTPHEIVVGLNDRDPALHDVYRLNIITGERKLIRLNNENIAGWMTDTEGNLRLAIRQNEEGGTDILEVVGEGLKPLYSVTFEETANPVRFTRDGKGLYLATNKGDVDKIQLTLLDLDSGKTTVIDKDPLDQVDFGGALFSDLTHELLLTYYVGDRVRVYPKQERFKSDYEKLRQLLPEGEIGFSSMTADENIWLVSISRDVDPGSVYLFDRTRGRVEFLYKSRPKLLSEWLSEMRPVQYKARDGMSIYGYLTVPKGLEPKNLPVVMWIHGGPWARDIWGYNAYAQFLANRGYAVFQPNFRGSVGYGKKYLNAGNKQWGTGSMQHDITDAVKYLIEQGIADPKRVAIAGGSYGGYATLAGLAFTPDLYACGFDIVGPSNIITLLNSIPPYWKPIQKVFEKRVGNMNDPEEKKMLEAQSPLNSATNIKAPLYVVQGANDPRVKKAESDQIVTALRDLGREVEYMVAPDEGHGFANELNRLAMVTAMEKFLAKHLGGRAQAEVREEIQKKLKELTVDVKTVEVPKKAEVEKIEKKLPDFSGGKVVTGEFRYESDVSVMGQAYHLTIVRKVDKVVIEGKPRVVVTEKTEGIMTATDLTELDAITLRPIKKNFVQAQGQATVEILYQANKVTGKIKIGTQERPVEASLNEPVLAGGAATEVAMATLPLEVGYKTYLANFDIMSSRVQSYVLEVKYKETVKIKAGEFETIRVELFSLEDNEVKQTLWYDTRTRVLVKGQTRLPAQAGGGMMVYELAN